MAHKVTELFRFLGCLLAKALQDGRLVDIPLSRPFLKLMCMGEVGSNLARHYVVEHHTGAACAEDDSDSDDEMTTPAEVLLSLHVSFQLALIDYFSLVICRAVIYQISLS